MCCCSFFDIILTSWQIFKLCNSFIICGDRSHQVIRFVIVCTHTISCFNIFCSIYFKSNFCQVSGNILKQMLYSAFCTVQKCYLIQKFSFFIDNQKSRRYFIFHFYFLNLSSIFQSEFHICSFQIPIRCDFLSQRIFFSNNKTLDHMRLVFYRSPFINNIALLIKNFHVCTIQLCSGSNIRFCDFYCCWLIFLYFF